MEQNNNKEQKSFAALIVDGHYFIRNNTKTNKKINVANMVYEWEKKWNLQIEQRYWYTNILNEEKHPQLTSFKRFLMSHDKGHFDVKEYPIKQKKCPICHGIQKVQSGVDVGIALRLFKLAQQYNHILLLAGDGDFTEALEELRDRNNKIFYLIGFQNTISLRLQPYAKYVLYLDGTNNINYHHHQKNNTEENRDDNNIEELYFSSSSISESENNDNHNKKRKRMIIYDNGDINIDDNNNFDLFFILNPTTLLINANTNRYHFPVIFIENILQENLLIELWKSKIFCFLKKNIKKNEDIFNKKVFTISNIEFILIYSYWYIKHAFHFIFLINNNNNWKTNFIHYIKDIEYTYLILRSIIS